MAQYWLDAVGLPFDAVPAWIGATAADVEVFTSQRSALINDRRAANAQHRGAPITPSASDFDAVMRFRVLRPAASTWQLGGAGFVLRRVDDDNYVEVAVGSLSSQNVGNIRERLVGNTNDTQIPALYAGAGTEWRWLRARLTGNLLQVRAWADGDAQPGTWAAEHTLDATPLSGTGHVLLPFAAGSLVEISGVGFGTGADTAPYGPTRVISGVIEDEQGLIPAPRVVRVYDRDSGALVGEAISDAVTGAFSVPAETLGGYTVLVVDDAAGLVENDYAVRVSL